MFTNMIARMTPPPESPGPPRNHSSRPEREPPKDDNGRIVCRHKECEGKDVYFRRPCEYNKHMDRHERPYHCSQPACEQNPGFTYSGGLLRHQREVHKMYLAREPLFCPHSNCVRSAGTGFTRKENLEEHLRRRHSGSVEMTASKPNAYTTPPLDSLSANRKRVRQMSDIGDDFSHGLDEQAVPTDDAEAVKRLRMIVAQRDVVIMQQAQELDRLRQLIQSLPHQMVYQAMPLATHPN